MKERLFLKDHTGQHAAETPHVQTVIIHLFTQYNTHLTINNLKKTAICDIQKLLLNINQIIKITIYKQWLSICLTSDMLRMREWCSKYHCCLNIIVVYFMQIWLLLTAFYCCLSCDNSVRKISDLKIRQWGQRLSILGVDRLSAPILSILPIIDIGHFQNRFADNYYFFI